MVMMMMMIMIMVIIKIKIIIIIIIIIKIIINNNNNNSSSNNSNSNNNNVIKSSFAKPNKCKPYKIYLHNPIYMHKTQHATAHHCNILHARKKHQFSVSRADNHDAGVEFLTISTIIINIDGQPEMSNYKLPNNFHWYKC